MIDAFYIFTKGGLLLWSTQLVKVKGNPLDRLIREVLLEERVGETNASLDSYSMKWKLVSEMDLFFVAVYQGILQISYLEGLLSLVSKEFLAKVVNDFGTGLNLKHVDFNEEFRKAISQADKEHLAAKKAAAAKRSNQVSTNGQNNSSPKKGKNGEGKENVEGNDEDEDGADGDGAAQVKGRAVVKGSPAKSGKKEENGEQKKKGKEARVWGGEGKVTAQSMKDLDFSKKLGADEDEAEFLKKQAEFVGDQADQEKFMNEDEVASLSGSSDGEEEQQNTAPKANTRSSGLFKVLAKSVKNLTGGAVLTQEDLDPILKSFKTALMSRNVAADVATKLSDSVNQTLVGKRTDRFTSMTATVKGVLQESMETILTPKKSVDVLRAAIAAKNAGRVFSLCFLGVNGVGKSTNLAKVAYYLKHKGGLNVLICACDTFRAGAVEQLKTHSRCLDVPLFERGYGKDPADIAKQALAYASANGHDVVLIDTAGRMQDNEPLMKALAKLVAINNPDLVLFVGEALVGNDAIDQVTKFNRSLIDYSHDPRNPRGIDGMLLTKYDTVDDKVGAALSMVYVTGQPIVFVGTGQKYTHLRKLQVKEVVRTLCG